MRIEREGFTLHCEVAGSASETVVLTHGLGSSGATWNGLVGALAPRYRVVTWDLRSHARSGSPDAPCSPAALAADLAAVIAGTGGTPVHAVGHSAGGVVAMQLAITHPELVRSLMLVGTSSECNARAAAFYESLAEVAERDGGLAALRRLGTGAETPLPPDGPGLARVARAMASLHPAPLTPRLADVRCPALVVVGAEDALGVGGSVILSRRLARARLEIVSGRGHSIFHEDPEGFARLLLAFLAEQATAS